MNATKKVLWLCLMVLGIFGSVQTVNAYASGLSDSRVDLIWWSQGGGSNTYWTGVTNKISYDVYRPCVGPNYSEFGCGVSATQSQYSEYGLWISSTINENVHGLITQSGGFTSPLQYAQVVRVTAADR